VISELWHVPLQYTTIGASLSGIRAGDVDIAHARGIEAVNVRERIGYIEGVIAALHLLRRAILVTGDGAAASTEHRRARRSTQRATTRDISKASDQKVGGSSPTERANGLQTSDSTNVGFASRAQRTPGVSGPNVHNATIREFERSLRARNRSPKKDPLVSRHCSALRALMPRRLGS
jgi:hypothetical protein